MSSMTVNFRLKHSIKAPSRPTFKVNMYDFPFRRVSAIRPQTNVYDSIEWKSSLTNQTVNENNKKKLNDFTQEKETKRITITIKTRAN